MSRLKSYGLMLVPNSSQSSRPAFLLSRLTAQENRILSLACQSCLTAEIASQLHLNEQEVQLNLQKVADKMGLSDCSALIHYIRCRDQHN